MLEKIMFLYRKIRKLFFEDSLMLKPFLAALKVVLDMKLKSRFIKEKKLITYTQN